MYAIVNIAGQQFKVEKEQKIFVSRLDGKEGDTLKFDEVLLIDNDKNILVGDPILKGAMITGKLLSHAKGEKVKVFKKKRRKGYQVLNGHRQQFTEVQIKDIMEKGAGKPEAVQAKASGDTKKAPAGKETPAAKPAASAKSGTSGKAATPKKPAAGKKAETGQKTAAPKKTEAAGKSTSATQKAATKKPVKKPGSAGKTTSAKSGSAGQDKKPSGGKTAAAKKTDSGKTTGKK